MTAPGRVSARQAERLIGRLLTGITYASVALLVIGVALLIVAGISPLSGGPGMDPGRLVPDLVGLKPAGFLWIGPACRDRGAGQPGGRGAGGLRPRRGLADGRRVDRDPAGDRDRDRQRRRVHGLTMEVLTLAVAFIVILSGAELFTNGIEWFGLKLGLAEGAVGSVLAAVGTAMPETMIPIIAILFSAGAASSEVGVGAILGAPFMLATLAMFVTGVAVLIVARRRPTGDVMRVDTVVLAHDMRFFAIAYAIAIGAAFLPVDPTWLKLDRGGRS